MIHDVEYYIIYYIIISLINNWMVTVSWGLGASGAGSKVWVLTIGVLEVNPELDSIRAQRGRARSALLSRVYFNINSRLN